MLSAAEARAARGQLEPHAPVGLRLAAVTGARRGELAALRWEELEGDRLTVDSSIAIIRDGRKRPPELPDDPTKTANSRIVRLDDATCAQLEELRSGFAAYGPWIQSVGERPLGPELSAGGGVHATMRVSTLAGGSTTTVTGRQRSPSPPATTSGASRAASAMPTPR